MKDDPKLLPASPEDYRAADLLEEGKSEEEIARELETSVEEVHKALAKPAVRGYLSKYLDDAGATLEASAKVIAEAHKANAAAVVSFRGDATVVDLGPDHPVRMKAAELNLKARGELKDGASINLFADLDDETVAKIAAGLLDPAKLIDTGPRQNQQEKPLP